MTTDQTPALRDTYASVGAITYRAKAASDLLGITPHTLKVNAQDANLVVPREMAGSVPNRSYTPELLFKVLDFRRGSNLQRIHKFSKPVVCVSYVIKGGTGKTTTAVETAVNLQFLGLRTLVIDLDVQANITHALGYEPDLVAEEIEQYGANRNAVIDCTMRDFLEYFLASEEIQEQAKHRFDNALKYPFGECGPALLASDQFLCDLEGMIANMRGPRELILKKFFTTAAEGGIPGLDLSNFDVVMIDCPPQTTFTTRAALAAADLTIAPVRMDAFAIKGLSRLVIEVNSLTEDYGVKQPELCILRTHYSSQVSRTLRMHQTLASYKDLVCENVINICEDFPASIDKYLPLTIQKPQSIGSRDYKIFAQDIYKRIVEIDKNRSQSGRDV